MYLSQWRRKQIESGGGGGARLIIRNPDKQKKIKHEIPNPFGWGVA